MPAGTFRDRIRPGPGLSKRAGTTRPGAQAYTTITQVRGLVTDAAHLGPGACDSAAPQDAAGPRSDVAGPCGYTNQPARAGSWLEPTMTRDRLRPGPGLAKQAGATPSRPGAPAYTAITRLRGTVTDAAHLGPGGLWLRSDGQVTRDSCCLPVHLQIRPSW